MADAVADVVASEGAFAGWYVGYMVGFLLERRSWLVEPYLVPDSVLVV